MSIYVTNDLHGNPTLIERVVSAISRMTAGDVLIINGDGAGSRGPRMNRIVKIFYEVRRGETGMDSLITALAEVIGKRPDIPDHWVYDSVHAGVFRAIVAKHYSAFGRVIEAEIFEALDTTLLPLSRIARTKGVRILYVPGNGEMIPGDFSVDDITVERALPPERRFYQRIAREGYFSRFGIEYVPYTYNLLNGVAILSTDLLDLGWLACAEKLRSVGLLGMDNDLESIVVHYPPAISPIGGSFKFWTPNKVDRARIEALNKILHELQVRDVSIFFGHIHLGPDDPRMTPYPSIMGFEVYKNYGFWIKPGSVVKIKSE